VAYCQTNSTAPSGRPVEGPKFLTNPKDPTQSSKRDVGSRDEAAPPTSVFEWTQAQDDSIKLRTAGSGAEA